MSITTMSHFLRDAYLLLSNGIVNLRIYMPLYTSPWWWLSRSQNMFKIC